MRTETPEATRYATATVRFLCEWANSSGKVFAAGSEFTRRGKTPERARANVARWASAWIHDYRGQLILVAPFKAIPIATFITDEVKR